MGFDFTMLDTTKKVSNNYQPLFADSPHSYQLSSQGVGMLLNLLDDLLDETIQSPDLAALWPPEGLDEGRAEGLLEFIEWNQAIAPLPSDAEMSDFKTKLAHINNTLSTQSLQAGKIPLFKFLTNDGWIFSSKECELMQQKLAKFTEGDPNNYEGAVKEMLSVAIEWHDFVRTAKEHGGFRVD